METNKIYQGDCLEVMKTFEDNSIDAIVTDPPYGLSFMGKKWDYDVPSQEIWEECLRVLKPGGYLLAFAGTRTQHRMAVRIEDAGFEIRDMIAWVYGSGFPKSLNIGKAVDKLQGNERESLGIAQGVGNNNTESMNSGVSKSSEFNHEYELTKGTSEWEGWGTALKPALEPITVARKPLQEKTVAENCLKWGVGGINIDECRVEAIDQKDFEKNWSERKSPAGFNGDSTGIYGSGKTDNIQQYTPLGRFPANLIHDNSEEVRECFPELGRSSKLGKNCKSTGGWSTGLKMSEKGKTNDYSDSGNASRFFKSILYYPKASKSERNKGCEELGGNKHCTVKPIALMEYLVKLVSREGALVLDPFAGSGSTLIACKKLNRNYIGIELTPEYIPIIEARLSAVKINNKLF